MEEKVGSYVIDKDGNHKPNADDEAMADRHGLKKEDGKKKKEVTKDAGK